MMRIGAAAGLSLVLAGCASVETGPAAPPVPTTPVVSNLTGHGAFRTPSGERASCAGDSVALNAETPQTRERMIALYGSADHAMAPVWRIKTRSASLPKAVEAPLAGSARCDKAGDFALTGLAPGGYFLIARVKVAPPLHGDESFVIMRRLELAPGETRDVSLAP
jgi:hypothetical protein